MPAERRHFAQRHARLFALIVEQTKLDLGCDLGKDGEIGAASVERGAERKRLAGPDLHRAAEQKQGARLPTRAANVGPGSDPSDRVSFSQP
jgi:hypothetical protein